MASRHTIESLADGIGSGLEGLFAGDRAPDLARWPNVEAYPFATDDAFPFRHLSPVTPNIPGIYDDGPKTGVLLHTMRAVAAHVGDTDGMQSLVVDSVGVFPEMRLVATRDIGGLVTAFLKNYLKGSQVWTEEIPLIQDPQAILVDRESLTSHLEQMGGQRVDEFVLFAWNMGFDVPMIDIVD